MNKRQMKKVARIKNNWHPNKVVHDYDCPYCSWCSLNDEEFKFHKILHQEADYLGKIDWDFEVKCPCCGTIFEYSDSNM